MDHVDRSEEIEKQIKANAQLTAVFQTAVENFSEHLKARKNNEKNEIGETADFSRLAGVPGFCEAVVLASIRDEIDENGHSLESAVSHVRDMYKPSV